MLVVGVQHKPDFVIAVQFNAAVQLRDNEPLAVAICQPEFGAPALKPIVVGGDAFRQPLLILETAFQLCRPVLQPFALGGLFGDELAQRFLAEPALPQQTPANLHFQRLLLCSRRRGGFFRVGKLLTQLFDLCFHLLFQCVVLGNRGNHVHELLRDFQHNRVHLFRNVCPLAVALNTPVGAFVADVLGAEPLGALAGAAGSHSAAAVGTVQISGQ